MVDAKGFRKRGRLFVAIVVLMLSASAAVYFRSGRLHQVYSSRISASIRQKALADEITSGMLRVGLLRVRGSDPTPELEPLKLTILRWENAQKALVNGAEIYGVHMENSPSINALLQESSPSFNLIHEKALALVNAPAAAAPDSLLALQPGIAAYRTNMDAVVSRFMQEDAISFARLRWAALALFLLSVAGLVFYFRFVMRPAALGIDAHSDDIDRLQEELDEANRVKTEFLANMSHEIRTPLNGVIGMTELLSRTGLDDTQRGYVRNIHSSAINLLDLVNDILDYSQIQAGKLEIRKERFILSECVDQVIDLMKPLANAKRLELISDLDPQLPDELLQDERRLRQVLLNLVNNAIKFTENGEIVVRAELISRESDFVQVKFSVTDTGIGIAEKDLPRLFQSFVQADSSTMKKHAGSGLGLAISKTLVGSMGGRIWVESSPGKGSTFFFTIIAESSGESHMAKIQALKGLKALVVDDNKTNLKILVKQLSAWGIQATPFNSPDLVTDIVSDMHKFDLCIIDMQMPEMDGAALAGQIRTHYSSEELPIIVLSSIGEHLVDQRGDLYNAYLTKPVRQARLLDAIIGVMRLSPSDMARERMSQGNYEGNFQQHKLKVLVANGNELSRAVTEKTLQLLGHRFVSVDRGQAIIDQARQEEYDLIIMDVDLPEMDGVETVRRLKRSAGKNDLPVIFGVTSNADRDTKPCLQAGMDDMVARPMNPEELQRKIHYWFDEAN